MLMILVPRLSSASVHLIMLGRSSISGERQTRFNAPSLFSASRIFPPNGSRRRTVRYVAAGNIPGDWTNSTVAGTSSRLPPVSRRYSNGSGVQLE